jgi:hypothetical protein
MTVVELLDRIDSHEITEWRAFFEVERFEHEMAQAKANRRM